MRKSISLVALLMMSTAMFAQISTGEPNSSVIPRTGNRPQKGDFGLYIGGSVMQIWDLVDYCVSEHTEGAWGLPMINLKYYCTDNWEFRMGFQFSAASKKTKTTISGSDQYTKTRNARDYTRLNPGCAYHFNTKNLLDVYVGAQMPIGFNTESYKQVGTDNSEYKSSTGTFVIGGGIFMGLQFFIADLPFAIGVEGGYSGLIKAQGVPRIVEKTNSDTQKYRQGTAETSAQWGADAALTFSYYFQR